LTGLEEIVAQKEHVNQILKTYCNKRGFPFEAEVANETINNYIINETITEAELMDILIAIISEYFFNLDINEVVEKERLMFLLQNGVDEEKEESQIEFGQTPPPLEPIGDNELLTYINENTKIETDLGIDAVIATHFALFLETLNKHYAKDMNTKPMYDYIKVRYFLLEAISLFRDIDFTIEIKELKEVGERLEEFVVYFDKLRKMKEKYSKDDYFEKIFIKYQPKYLYTSALFKRLINSSSTPPSDIKIGKLQEMLERYNDYYKREFTRVMHDFLAKNEKILYILLSYHAKRAYDLLAHLGRRSKPIREFFIEKKLKGEFSVAAFIPYFVSNSKLTQAQKSDIKITERYLQSKSKRDIVIISENVNEVTTIRRIVSELSEMWDVYAFAKVDLADSYFASRVPYVIFVDYHFRYDSKSLFIHIIGERYPKFKASNRLIVLYNQIKLDELQRDVIDKNYQYLKRPLSTAELTNILRFI
jgi:hypothetical protein